MCTQSKPILPLLVCVGKFHIGASFRKIRKIVISRRPLNCLIITQLSVDFSMLQWGSSVLREHCSAAGSCLHRALLNELTQNYFGV